MQYICIYITRNNNNNSTDIKNFYLTFNNNKKCGYTVKKKITILRNSRFWI